MFFNATAEIWFCWGVPWTASALKIFERGARALKRIKIGHHEDRTPTHDYAATREAAMAAFAKG